MSEQDRWTDNGPECPYCGRRVRSLTSRECSTCAVEPVQEQPERTEPQPASSYPRLSMTPAELEAYRQQCETFDREQRLEGERTNGDNSAQDFA
jgi:hypothetical protein